MKILLICLAGIVCFWPIEEICEQREYRVACIGDSITVGSYPDILQDILGEGAEVRRYARNGLTMRGLIDELSFALKLSPTHVVVYGGINDCVSHREKASSLVVEKLNKMIVDIQDAGAIAIIVKHHNWDGSTYDRTPIGYGCSSVINKKLDEEYLNFESAIIVDTSSLGYQDVKSECPKKNWLEDDKYCTRSHQLKDEYDAGDGLHLNYEGSRVLAHLVAEAIQGDKCF